MRSRYLVGASLLCILVASCATEDKPQQVSLGYRNIPVIKSDGLIFKDLDRNGRLDAYEDWRLPAARRVDDLVGRMTVKEEAGMMMLATNFGFMGPNGEVMAKTAPLPHGTLKSPVNISGVPGFEPSDKPSPSDLVLKNDVHWIGAATGGTPASMATWANRIQEIAETSRLGIPVVLATDPVHTTNRLPGGEPPPPTRLKITSSWPDQIGLAAIGKPEVVESFGRIGAAEFRAMGIRMVVNPMADVTTEPRWNRIPGTFGENADLAAKLVGAFVRGYQGNTISKTSVLTSVKHFPGDGPVSNGLDPHNTYGRLIVYPTGNLAYHLLPFKAGIQAGTSDIMLTYGIPNGIDTVGAAFSKTVVTKLLREKMGFKGIVLSDWLRAMPWGVDDLSQKDRQLRMLEAGVDQFGGEHDPEYIVALEKSGQVSRARLDESIRRILLPMFEMGLFENPYVDVHVANDIVNSPDYAKEAFDAQVDSNVLLKNRNGILPLRKSNKVFLIGYEKTPLLLQDRLAPSIISADIVIVKVNAPYRLHNGKDAFFKKTHEGPLVYRGSENIQDLEAIKMAIRSGKPVVVVMNMERPAVLSEFIGSIDGFVAIFGAGDEAVSTILVGKRAPTGKLPFDIPGDEESVEDQNEDQPHDFKNVMFQDGFGLSFPKTPPR